MQQHNLVVAQVGGGCRGNVAVPGGGHDHHNHMRAFQRFANPVSHFCKFSKTADATRVFQVYPAAFGNDFNVGESAIVERDFFAHQGHMRRHRLAPVAGSDDCISQIVVHGNLFLIGNLTGARVPKAGSRRDGRLHSRLE